MDIRIVEVLNSRTVLWRMRSREPGLAGDAIDRIDLDAPSIEQRFEHLGQLEALDLLVVATGSGKQQYGCAEVPPTHDARGFRQPLRVPAPVLFPALRHGRLSARQRCMRSKNRSVKLFHSCAGYSASTFLRTACLATSLPKKSCAT